MLHLELDVFQLGFNDLSTESRRSKDKRPPFKASVADWQEHPGGAPHNSNI